MKFIKQGHVVCTEHHIIQTLLLVLYFQTYSIFSIYLPIVQFSTSCKTLHPPEMKVLLYSFFQNHFIVQSLERPFLRANHKVDPSSPGTLWSCTPRYTYQDYDMNQQWLCRILPIVMVEYSAISRPPFRYNFAISKSFVYQET